MTASVVLEPRAPPVLGPVTDLPGIGRRRAELLARLGLASIRDLLLFIPRRLERWDGPIAIVGAREVGRRAEVRGRLVKSSFSRFGRRSLLRVRIEDESGAIDCLFFNQPWLRERLQRGSELHVYGRIVEARGPALVALRLASAERPFPVPGELVAHYPASAGLSSAFLRELCRGAAREHAARLAEPLGARDLEARGMLSLERAAHELHFPSALEHFESARRRVALEPLLALQARLLARARDARSGSARALVPTAALESEVCSLAGLVPTSAQREAMAAIRADLARSVPMRRLLQGDVGSGKTLVATFACAAAARAGAQAALLAPTEILAEQHCEATREVLAALGVRAVLLTGSLSARERRAALAALSDGSAQVAFGTHALFSQGVRFASLALAVIDEQHRFGVEQRMRLLDKGRDVHALLLTATPIPRTLALALYGDLEVSTMRERPPGRGALVTQWLAGRERAKLPALLSERLARGEQAFWVVPRIGASGEEESEDAGDAGARGAEQRFAALSRGPLARFGLELVHGRMPRDERAQRLQRFRSGASRLLVATTVIEVGVDVPAATAIVIESAERLGLAQLHQLRGRVGRGERSSSCWILGASAAAERFRFLERESDGFAIAEEDLRRRGMGDLAGVRQAGENSEGLSDLESDLELLLAARELLCARPELARIYLDPRGVPSSA